LNARRRPLVVLYALGSAGVLAALSAVTVLVLRQQADHARAVADALHQEDVRTALWRMETRISTLLAMTTSRAVLAPPAPGAYAANSLAGDDNDIRPAPQPNAEVARELVDAADRAFAAACGPDVAPSTEAPTATWTNPEQQNIANRGVQRSVDEYERRKWSNYQAQVVNPDMGPTDGDALLIGPLASRWDRSSGALGLQFARRIQGPGGASHESYRVEWSELSGLLLAEITDLFPSARLEPIEEPEAAPARDDRALRLAALPARLVVPPPLPAEELPRGFVWTLGGAWAALVFALAVGALALRSGYAYGDRHRRFTHAVTHELRTPLTTFRMYSEMLARGMVPEASRAAYLATLEAESGRLARLVDNVLRYARLEDGRQGARRERIGAAELVQRCVPELARTCANHGARLELQDLIEGDAALETDAEAVLQILSNLVENACKYGRSADRDESASIVLRATFAAGRLALEIADDGPGVPAAVQRSIFAPFDRGGRDASDPAPGVGLGLALSRALATELGGELTLEASARGATFRLALPA
jgi:signal transduction histidine kinase